MDIKNSDFINPPGGKDKTSSSEKIKISAPDIKVGETVRTLRKKMGLKPAQLAEKIGKSQSYINTLESGKNDPYVDVISLICDFFDVTSPFLVLGKEYETPSIEGELGEYLARLRQDAGMKSGELAEKLGVSISLIAKIEKTSKITIRNLLKYADVFDISFLNLLSFIPSETLSSAAKKAEKEQYSYKTGTISPKQENDLIQAIKEIVLSDNEKHLLDQYAALDDNIKAIVDNILAR